MNLKKKSVLFLDLQTTGAKPDTANILEVAWASSLSEFSESYLISQPEDQPVPRRIQFITGIYDKHMIEARPLMEAFSLLKAFIKSHCADDTLAVIHFAQFEKPFLLDAYEKLQEEMPFRILCTHEIAKRLFPNLPTRGIKGLAGYFGCPSGEFKRAAGHVQATQVIWQGLTAALEEKGIADIEALNNWLSETPKAARGKYEYPLPKEKRLSLPKQPGIYRMMSRWGEVLYVGKATSLHDRVNSYFRGQKNRDSRKLEMLTQVFDLHVTPVGSPLEAALLETDEIKRLNPPYNVSLKVGRRELAFFNRDFTNLQSQADADHFIGPFSNSMALDSVRKLSQSLQAGIFDENMFFEPLDPQLMESGFELFCLRHGFLRDSFKSVRSILAVGLNWFRQLEEEDEEAIEIDIEAAALSEAASEEEAEIVLTPEDLADKYERHFIRSAAAYLRTKKLTQLLNSTVQIKSKKDPLQLKIARGQVVPEHTASAVSTSWKDLSVDTYDRMTVLYTELNKLRAKHDVLVRQHKNNVLQSLENSSGTSSSGYQRII